MRLRGALEALGFSDEGPATRTVFKRNTPQMIWDAKGRFLEKGARGLVDELIRAYVVRVGVSAFRLGHTTFVSLAYFLRTLPKPYNAPRREPPRPKGVSVRASLSRSPSPIRGEKGPLQAHAVQAVHLNRGETRANRPSPPTELCRPALYAVNMEDF